mmetsp:Transcript_130553/g.325725  ORF Transcript_130553/g.325725 Transcript_130553/m.325725 type:complete len:314 (+) Transcript_130553:364-1305(+)
MPRGAAWSPGSFQMMVIGSKFPTNATCPWKSTGRRFWCQRRPRPLLLPQRRRRMSRRRRRRRSTPPRRRQPPRSRQRRPPKWWPRHRPSAPQSPDRSRSSLHHRRLGKRPQATPAAPVAKRTMSKRTAPKRSVRPLRNSRPPRNSRTPRNSRPPRSSLQVVRWRCRRRLRRRQVVPRAMARLAVRIFSASPPSCGSAEELLEAGRWTSPTTAAWPCSPCQHMSGISPSPRSLRNLLPWRSRICPRRPSLCVAACTLKVRSTYRPRAPTSPIRPPRVTGAPVPTRQPPTSVAWRTPPCASISAVVTPLVAASSG